MIGQIHVFAAAYFAAGLLGPNVQSSAHLLDQRRVFHYKRKRAQCRYGKPQHQRMNNVVRYDIDIDKTLL